MIDLNPIFPGQVSAFSVVSRYYPEIINAVVDFRKFSGESIPWSKSTALIEAEEAEVEGEGEGEPSAEDEIVAPAEELAQP
jgi:hypothetical protein